MATRKRPTPDPPADAQADKRGHLEWLLAELRLTWGDATDPFARSQLAAQIRGVVNDLAAIAPVVAVGSVEDDLKARRDARAQDRRPTPAAGSGTSGGNKPRGG